jgi:hypothetical protein
MQNTSLGLIQLTLASEYKYTGEADITRPEIRAGLSDVRQLIDRAYYALIMSGWTVEITTQSYEYDQLRVFWESFKRIPVSPDGTDCPYFDRRTNLRFRAVHDYHHFISEFDFSLMGEIKAFKHISSMVESVVAKQILFSEIVLQAAYTHQYGEFPAQKIVLSNLYLTV